MKIQTSSMQPVSIKKGPLNTLPENHAKATFQSTSGPVLKIQTEPTMVKYGAGTTSGTFQTSGDKVDINPKPMLGWQSANTPMSDRAVESKKNF